MSCEPEEFSFLVNTLVSKITSPDIEEIQLLIPIGHMGDLEAIDWPLFAQAFSLPQFAHLCSVRLWLGASADRIHTRDTIKAKLSELGRRDIFRVFCSFLYLHTCFEADIFVKDSNMGSALRAFIGVQRVVTLWLENLGFDDRVH
jgi:hypothetical protein